MSTQEHDEDEDEEDGAGGGGEAALLAKSGAVHTVLNSEVLGGAPLRGDGVLPPQKDAPPPQNDAKRAKSASAAASSSAPAAAKREPTENRRGGGAGGGGASGDIKPDGLFFTGRKPRAATSTSRTSTPPTAPGSVSECLGGAATYEEYVRKLQSDGSLAYKALCALAVWSGNDSASSFVGAVNALPRE